MVDDRIKSLWGQEFRVVAEGLAETDVVIFVEKLMRQHREKLKQLDHIAALHELAAKTVEDAEHLASGIREQSRNEAVAESARILTEAREKAREFLEKAERAVREQTELAKASIASTDEEYRDKARQRLAAIEAAFQALKEAAVRELSTRMRTHYIGKHLYQSVHFLPAFENLIKEVNTGIPADDREPPSAADSGPPPPRISQQDEEQSGS